MYSRFFSVKDNFHFAFFYTTEDNRSNYLQDKILYSRKQNMFLLDTSQYV